MCIDDVEIPKYSLAEELLNSISHGLGAIFGIVALVLMLIKVGPSGDPFAIASVIVYASLPLSIIGAKKLQKAIDKGESVAMILMDYAVSCRWATMESKQ